MNLVDIDKYIKRMSAKADRVCDKRVSDSLNELIQLYAHAVELHSQLPYTESKLDEKKVEIQRAGLYLEYALRTYYYDISVTYNLRVKIVEITKSLKDSLKVDKYNVDTLCYLQYMYTLLPRSSELDFKLTNEELDYLKLIEDSVKYGIKTISV